jgi:surface-anchored protein
VDAAVQPAPDAADFGFLDAAPGSDVYVIPQTEQRGVVWMGWNTQDPSVMERVDRGVTFTLHGTTGPGEVSVFLQNGNFGSPDVLWDSSITGAQDLWVDTNTHTHANWIFTNPGTYLLDFEISADLIDGQKVSDRQVLRFAVGDETDPEAAFTAEPFGGAEASGAEASTEDSREAAPEPGAEAPQQWMLPLLAGMVLVAVLTGGSVGVMRSGKARRRAHRDFLAELEASDRHTTAPAGGRR